MEENNKFSVRVERAFGSLPAAGGGAWSLSDGEMERREWIRKKGGLKPEDYDGEAWDIRYDVEAWDMQTSINEKEENECNKVVDAVDPLCSMNVTDYESDTNSYHELPLAFDKDPRANHIAAVVRLMEDEEAAMKTDHLRSSMDYAPTALETVTVETQEEKPIELPKSLIFAPKKKPGVDTSGINSDGLKQIQKDGFEEGMQKKGFQVGIADEEEQESGISEMEEDGPEVSRDYGISSSRRPGRQYRTKGNVDSDDISA